LIICLFSYFPAFGHGSGSKWEKLPKKHSFFLSGALFLSETRHRKLPKGCFYQKQIIGYSRKDISTSSSSSGTPDNELLSAATYRKEASGNLIAAARTVVCAPQAKVLGVNGEKYIITTIT